MFIALYNIRARHEPESSINANAGKQSTVPEKDRRIP